MMSMIKFSKPGNMGLLRLSRQAGRHLLENLWRESRKLPDRLDELRVKRAEDMKHIFGVNPEMQDSGQEGA